MGKAAGDKAMSKGALVKALATDDIKAKTCSQIINSFVAIATKEVKKTGVFAIPGLCRKDSDKASHQGRSEDHFRQRGQGRSQASQEGRQGVSSGSIEETNLEQ